MNQLRKFCIAFSLAAMSIPASAGPVNLPWSTSFENCIDSDYKIDGWASGSNETVWNNVNGGKNGSACSSNGYQQISRAANFQGGAGGCGWRRWVCAGSYNATGSISIKLNHEKEIWVRWYMRWQPGFEWNSSHGLFFQKVVYIRPIGRGIILDLQGADRWSLTANNGKGLAFVRGNTFFSPFNGGGWNTLNSKGAVQRKGIRLGDGSWHVIEFHFKNQSDLGQFDGEWDLWVDQSLIWHQTKINWDAEFSPGITSLQFMINQMTPSNPVPMYNDIDDIAISNTGYVGPYDRKK